MRGPRADHIEDTNHGEMKDRKSRIFRCLSSPYFYRAVMSFGEYRAKRGRFRACLPLRSQQPDAKTPANTEDFRGLKFEERDLPKG